jgi:predicted Zn-dependent protease with MMP-like domain
MTNKEFEKLVIEAIDGLPEDIIQKMNNLAIVVEKGTSDGPLLGLYEGIPKTAWSRGSGMILPDKITIFQAPLEKEAKNEEDLKKAVREVVIHEIAHHFGFDEKSARKMEKKNN